MRIESVEAFAYAIPVRSPGPATRWYERVSKQVLVKVTAEDGSVGWGEAFAYGSPLGVCDVVATVLAPAVVGQDVFALPRLVDRMQRAGRLAGRQGMAMFALSGVEIACWDLAGKLRGVPVHALIGGAARMELPAYASHPHYATPADVAEGCRASAAEGFKMVKLHQTDVASVAAARDAIGPDIRLMLDTNNAWATNEAVDMARALEPLDLYWLEEPIWPPEDYRALAAVRAQARMRIALGENEFTLTGFREIIALGAADVLQPSVTKCGGISTMLEVAAVARAANLPVIPHSFYFGPGLAATMHVAATFVGGTPVEFPLGALDAPVLKEPIVAPGGVIRVPEGPGLGVTVDEAAIARFRVAPPAGPPEPGKIRFDVPGADFRV